MSYSDDTVVFMASGFEPEPSRRTILTQTCLELSADELEAEKYRLREAGWRDVGVRITRDGDWRKYVWSGYDTD